MKQVVFGLMLIVSFAAHADSASSFSINEADTSDMYANKPDFKPTYCLPGSTSYEFEVVPTSVYGIKTSDLTITRGEICFLAIRDSRRITLEIKGKDSVDKFKDRAIKDYLKDFDCGDKANIQNSKNFFCSKSTEKNINRVSLRYDANSDSAKFVIQQLN